MKLDLKLHAFLYEQHRPQTLPYQVSRTWHCLVFRNQGAVEYITWLFLRILLNCNEMQSINPTHNNFTSC